jgi:Flp pilus assembly protein TadD
MQGDIARHEGFAREALAAYGRAAQLAANDARGWYGLGAVEGEREDVREARSDLTRAITLDATDASYRAELGTVESFAGNLPGARAQLQEALALQPDNYIALTGLGIVELKAGNTDAALEALQKATAIEPRYARAHVYLAAAYYRTRSDSAALFELTRAQELDPNDPLPHLLMSIIRLDRIEPGLAVAEAQEALARLPFVKSLNQVADNQRGVANVGTPLAFMGLEGWARSAAHESYLPFWGGSHLFLADRYPGDFDKRAELMQGFITDPIVFGASNRFQSLIAQPGIFGTVSLRYNQSNDLRLVEPVATINGFDTSHVPVSFFGEYIDTKIDPRDTAFSARGKTFTAAAGIKPTHDISAFVYANRLKVDADLGEQGKAGDFDRIGGTANRVDAGVRYALSSRNAIWVKGGVGDQDSTSDLASTIIGSTTTFFQASHFTLKPRANDLGLRHTFYLRDELELTWGAETARLKTEKALARDSVFHTSAVTVAQDRVDQTDHDRSDRLYAMGRWLTPAFQVELGGGWSDYRKDRDILVTLGASGIQIPVTENYRPRKFEPLAGALWRFAPASLVRGACRRWIRPTSLDTLAPVAVAGMPINDQLVYAGGTLDQCRAQLEWSDAARSFATVFVERSRVHNLVSPLDGVQNTASDVTNLDRLRNRALAPPPKPDQLEDLPVYSEGRVTRTSVALERIVTPQIGLRAYYTYTDSVNTDPNFAARHIPENARIPYLPRHQVNIGGTVAPGWHTFVTLQAVYRTQRFTDEANTLVLRSGWDAQVNVFWETPDKRWSAEIYGINLLKKDVSDIFGIIVSYRF